MPIYPQTYRTYDGSLRRSFRWWTVLEQELRLLARARIFRLLLLLAFIHFLFYFMVVSLYDFSRQNQQLFMQSNLDFILRMRMFMVDEKLFYMFLRMQSGLVFVVMIYAGAGMICNDFQNNLMEVYFAKPLTWFDYALGKFFALVAVGLMLTALPATLLDLYHNAMMASWDELENSFWWIGASWGFSLAIVLPCVAGVLAASAISTSQRYAAIAVFMIAIASSAMGVLLAQMLRDPWYLILSVPMVVNRVGHACFLVTRTFMPVSWQQCTVVLAILCAICLVIVFRRVRRAEVAG